jgi:hypothetical protein
VVGVTEGRVIPPGRKQAGKKVQGGSHILYCDFGRKDTEVKKRFLNYVTK